MAGVWGLERVIDVAGDPGAGIGEAVVVIAKGPSVAELPGTEIAPPVGSAASGVRVTAFVAVLPPSRSR